MSTTPFEQPMTPADERLARYLDGLMDAEERAAFERDAASDPALKAAIELDRRMIASLGSALAPEAPVTPAETPITRRVPRSRLFLGLAAAVALLACGAALWLQHMATSRLPTVAMKEPAQVYAEEVKAGFQPDWICGDDREMLEFTRSRFGAGLLFKPSEAVALVGWGYAEDSLSGNTATLLARVGDEKIVVLVDRAADARPVPGGAVAGGSLHVFRRQVGPYVLYEITPREAPAVLELAYAVPAEVHLQPGEPGPAETGPN